MLHSNRRSFSRHGFTLIELVVVLGIVGIVAAGLWRLMATANQQTKDQATAQQQSALIDAVKGYLGDITAGSGQAWLSLINGADPTANPANLPLPAPGTCATTTTPGYTPFCAFLPNGFNSATTNAYGQTYKIQVLKDLTPAGTAPQNYSFMIVASGAVIPDADGGRISGLIGGDGGFIYAGAVCTTAPTAPSTTACGALGSWNATVASYGFGATASGAIASRSYISSAQNDDSDDWLARVHVPGPTTNFHNTMTVDLFMGTTLAGVPTNIQLGTPTASLPTGAINLNYGVITGEGTVGSTTNAGNSQINLAVPPASVGDYVTNKASLVYLSGGCTTNNNPAVTTAVFDANCPSTLNVNGDITAAGILYQSKNISTSDARLKTDIHLIDKPLDNLMKIDAIAFRWKGGGSEDMGVTAQNLEKTYPQLVTEHNGIKYVEYNGLMGPLIGAVQELKRQNDDLRAQLAQQKRREDMLEKKLYDQNAGR